MTPSRPPPPASSAARPAPRPVNRWLILGAVMLAYTPVVVDMTILHIAVPSLTLALRASSAEVLWIIDIYPLLMAGLLVPMGTLADQVGHRRMLLIGLVVFGLASAVSAFAPTAVALIAGRAGLALGAAMLIPSVLAVVRQAFDDPKELALALGFWGTVSSAGAAVGPLVGGALLEHFWWGSVFLINVPIMLVVLPVAYAAIPHRAVVARGGWAFGQALILIAAMLSIVYAVKSGLVSDTPPALAAAMLLAGALLLAVFIRKQLTAPRPMLELGLFARPAILAGIVMAVVTSGAYVGVELTIAQELQYVIGRSPLEAGLFMLPLMIASAVGGPLAGGMVAWLGLRPVASGSLFLSAAALAGLAVSDFHHTSHQVTALMALLGLALSVGLTASSVAIMTSVTGEQAGAAGALESTGYELGAGLGISGFGVALGAVYGGALHLPEGLVPEAAVRAARSIGETFVIAGGLPEDEGAALIAAGRAAFSAAHTSLLLAAAGLIAALAVFVLYALRHYRGVSAEPYAG